MSVESKLEVEGGLSPDQLAQLEDRLRAAERSLTDRLGTRRQALAGVPARAADESDWASDSADQSLVARLVERDTKLREEVRAALGRIADGSYGFCEISGEPIGYERLLGRPWTRYGVAAKEEVERRRSGWRNGDLAPEWQS